METWPIARNRKGECRAKRGTFRIMTGSNHPADQTCANCFFYTNGVRSGACHFGIPNESGSWPSVQATEWCGEWSQTNVVRWQGPQGNPGIQGEKGEKGDKGDTGNQGNPGQRGQPGTSGILRIQGVTGPGGTFEWTFPSPFQGLPTISYAAESVGGLPTTVNIIALTSQAVTVQAWPGRTLPNSIQTFNDLEGYNVFDGTPLAGIQIHLIAYPPQD